ncbi:MAG: sialate O-acetylesterase [Opitutaceae bacterium]
MASPLALHPLFSDHAVLSRDVALPLSGRALPGQMVKVTLGDRRASARANTVGRWEAVIEPMPAGGPHVLSVSSSAGQLVRRDIMIGEVWLAAGGSGMALPLEKSAGGAGAIRRAEMARLRVLQVEPAYSATPLTECRGSWRETTPQSAAEASALGLHFGQTLLSASDCTIGLVQATVAQSRLVAWMQGESLRNRPDLRSVFSLRKKAGGDDADESFPSGLFNGMIAPLARSPVRGIIWHQGEADVGAATPYRTAFVELIRGWRVAWQNPALPFLFVQLPACLDGADDASAALREAQALAADLNDTAMIVAADVWRVGHREAPDVRAVAERLALAALAVGQGRSLPWFTPRPTSHEARGGSLRIHFREAAAGLRLRSGGAGGFQIAGRDRRFVDAEVEVDGDVIRVTSPAIGEPVAVRYGWSSQPELSLETSTGLPIAPFRTDDWPAARDT